MVRLTAEFWVEAYLTRLRLADIPAFVVAHGDDTAGAVLVKLNTLDGQAVRLSAQFDLMTGDAAWVVLADGAEADVDAAIARQREFDPDLWVIEVEDRAGAASAGRTGAGGLACAAWTGAIRASC